MTIENSRYKSWKSMKKSHNIFLTNIVTLAGRVKVAQVFQFLRNSGQRLPIENTRKTKMAEESTSKVKHIVADSAAFLKNASLHEMCENVYTIEDVVNEIRDATTRQRLAVLPYNIQFREPSTEALHAGKLEITNCRVLL